MCDGQKSPKRTKVSTSSKLKRNFKTDLFNFSNTSTNCIDSFSLEPNIYFYIKSNLNVWHKVMHSALAQSYFSPFSLHCEVLKKHQTHAAGND